MARASSTITRRALNARVDAGNWRVTEWIYSKGKVYVQLVNTVTRRPRTMRAVKNRNGS